MTYLYLSPFAAITVLLIYGGIRYDRPHRKDDSPV